MGIPILSHFLFQGILVELNIQSLFLHISSYTFGTGYSIENIGFKYSFNSKSTGSVFQVPRVQLDNSLNFIIILAIQYVVFLSNVGINFS